VLKTVTVVEADNLIVHLHCIPNITCITSMDADHLDIYGTSEEVKKSFIEFADKIKDKNDLFITKNCQLKELYAP
jgi:UDP-N-acetylmuramate--alanine ligase